MKKLILITVIVVIAFILWIEWKLSITGKGERETGVSLPLKSERVSYVETIRQVVSVPVHAPEATSTHVVTE